MRSALVVLGVIVGAGSLVLLGPTGAASAAAPVVPIYTDDGTGSGPALGVRYGDLVAFPTFRDYDSTGWTTDPSFGSERGPGVIGGTYYTGYAPIYCWFGEPIRHGGSQVDLTYNCRRFDLKPTLLSAAFSVGPANGHPAVVTCAYYAHSSPADQFTLTNNTTLGDTGGDDYSDGTVQSGRVSPLGTGDCPYLVSITVEVGVWSSAVDSQTSKSFTWTAAQAYDPRPIGAKGDDALACTALNEVDRVPACTAIIAASNPEASYTCPWDWGTSGDWFADFATWVGGYTTWAGCMFIPRGWDRAHALSGAISGGSAAATAAALTHSLPGSLACGPVGTLPLVSGSLALNTCPMDVFPTPLKNVIGYAMVLPVAWLGVKRVFWALGGDSAPNVKTGKSGA